MRHGLTAATLLVACLATAGPVRAQMAPPPGMQQYFLGFLNRGPASSAEDTAEARAIQAGHMANIQKMADAGALVAAGPMEGNRDLRGIFIFVVKSADEARALAASDPAIQQGRLVLDLHPWIGPAGIGARYRAEHQADPALTVTMRTYQLGLLRKGPTVDPDRARANQRAHLQHIADMQAAGRLAAVGPMVDEGDVQGIVIFNTDAAEARALAAEDPHVKAGHLVLDLYTWWCAEHVMPDVLPPVPVPNG